MSFQRARERLITCCTNVFIATGVSVNCVFTLAIELSHAGHGLRDILDGMLDGLQVVAGPDAEIGFCFKQRFRVKADGRNGVVDVVGDTARYHLA